MIKHKHFYDPLLVVDHMNIIQVPKRTEKEKRDMLDFNTKLFNLIKEKNIKLMVNGKEWNTIKENGT